MDCGSNGHNYGDIPFNYFDITKRLQQAAMDTNYSDCYPNFYGSRKNNKGERFGQSSKRATMTTSSVRNVSNQNISNNFGPQKTYYGGPLLAYGTFPYSCYDMNQFICAQLMSGQCLNEQKNIFYPLQNNVPGPLSYPENIFQLKSHFPQTKRISRSDTFLKRRRSHKNDKGKTLKKYIMIQYSYYFSWWMMPKSSDSTKVNTNINKQKGSRKRRSEVVPEDQQLKNKPELTEEVVLDIIKEEETKVLSSPVTKNIKRRKGEELTTEGLKCDEEFKGGESPVKDCGMILKSSFHQIPSLKTSSKDKISSSQSNNTSNNVNEIFDNFHVEYEITLDTSKSNTLKIKTPPDFILYGNSNDVIDLMYKKCEIYPKSFVIGRLPQTKLDFEHRITVLSWLMDVAYEERQSRVTFHLAVNYFDRALAASKFQLNSYQLIASACLKLASKMEEIHSLTSDTIVERTCLAFSTLQLKKMETLVSHTLEFSMNPLTTLHFVDFYYRIISHTCDLQGCATPSNSSTSSRLDILNASTVSSSQSSNTSFDGERNNDEIEKLFFSEEPIVLQEGLIEYYLTAVAMVDFICLTNPCQYFDSSKLAAAILYAQFADFDGDLNFSKYNKDDISEEYDYILPFFKNIDQIMEDYKEKSEFIGYEEDRAFYLQKTKKKVNEDHRYRVQTFTSLFNDYLKKDEIKEHILYYQDKYEKLSLDIALKKN
uniref:CYCLIN domain-containing protein n=1 Tax=Parastrongyloides trichosuri TaxID=131310 RepID=A0A0N4ZNP1_PARTI